MRGRKTKWGLLLSICTLMCSCASLQKSQLELSQDSFVSIGNEDPILHKKGERIPVPETQPMLIESPGRIGVLVLPQSTNSTNTKLSLRPSDQWASQFIQSRIDRGLNELVSYINEIQILLSARRLGEAKVAITFLRKRYPKVAHLKFLEASYLATTGDRTRAVGVLADLIEEHPDSQAGRDFLISLTKAPVILKSAPRSPAAENAQHDEDEDEEATEKDEK